MLETYVQKESDDTEHCEECDEPLGPGSTLYWHHKECSYYCSALCYYACHPNQSPDTE
jgi:hypothetical protein